MKKLIIAGVLTAILTACAAKTFEARKAQIDEAADKFCALRAQVKNLEMGEGGSAQ